GGIPSLGCMPRSRTTGLTTGAAVTCSRLAFRELPHSWRNGPLVSRRPGFDLACVSGFEGGRPDDQDHSDVSVFDLCHVAPIALLQQLIETALRAVLDPL